MDITCTRIPLGIILSQLLLLCLPYLSIADVIYHPDDLLSINCGSSINFSMLDTRNWIGDIKFLSEGQDSVGAPALTPSTQQGPYTYARLSHSKFTYSFPVTAGPKFLRLFFYSTSYDKNFDRSKAYFSVKAGPYTLLQDFNASLNADAVDDPGQPDILFREYCINLHQGERLNITFNSSTTDSYAFINGIEIVSMPPYLYYTNPDLDGAELPREVGLMNPFPIERNLALETTHRLRAGDAQNPPSLDTGMLRTWDSDDNYITTQSVLSGDIELRTKLNFTEMTPSYTAPDSVYRTIRNMGLDASINTRYGIHKGYRYTRGKGQNAPLNQKSNLTWQFPVDSRFTYLLRLHFCEPGDLIFIIFIQDQLVEDRADVFSWSNKQRGVPVVREYAVFIPGNLEKANLSLKLHPHSNSSIKDAQLNAIELFKLDDPTGSLAGPNPPEHPLQIPKVSLQSSNSKTRTIAAVASAVSSVTFLSLIVAFFLTKRRNNVTVTVNKDSNEKEGTSRGNGSLSLSTDSRHFSVTQMTVATNNFDQVLVVGEGGFGDVYKGHIDNDSTRVAIKRRKPGSRQGVQEFKNEIELLSQLRHPNIVSLIGYCYDNNDMILVYEFMDNGTLREHLYDTHNPSLSWKQRLEICIGAARGLHHLRTGTKHMIIHRDVKSTNILLDENWVAKVSDFGLSRIGPTDISITSVNTQVKGSIGYLDPEYYKRHLLTEKSDVYSFGVLLLEVLSGREPLIRWEEKQKMSLVSWAKRCYEKGTLRDIVDVELKSQIAPECLHKFGEIALSCLVEDGTERPSMNNVVEMLEFVLKLQDGVMVSDGDYEDSKHVISSDYIERTGLIEYHKRWRSSITSDGDRAHESRESGRMIPEYVFSVTNVFSEIKDPKGR